MDNYNFIILMINIAFALLNGISYYRLRKYSEKTNNLLDKSKALLDKSVDMRNEAKRYYQLTEDLAGDTDEQEQSNKQG